MLKETIYVHSNKSNTVQLTHGNENDKKKYQLY